jgi:hypothetical protein
MESGLYRDIHIYVTDYWKVTNEWKEGVKYFR